MTIIPFPPPPPPPPAPEPEPKDKIPSFDLYDLNEDQLATLAMMGLDEQAIVDRYVERYFVEPDRDEAISTASIAGTHILRHHAPVVMHLGRRKTITIDGDIKTLDGPRRTFVF